MRISPEISVDKAHFDPNRARQSLDEQAFSQVASRFDQYLRVTESASTQAQNYGLLIHDNNQTVARKHTQLMKRFHQQGTLWTDETRIIETPLFVDSELTGMIQIADLFGYSLRRYLESVCDIFRRLSVSVESVTRTGLSMRHT